MFSSHVGAVLFAVEAGVRIREAQTCTSLSCKWLMPTAVKSVPYEELCSIDFTSAKAKKRKLDDKISDISTQSAELAHGCQAFPKNPSYVPSQDQIKTFYESSHGTGIKPAMNALVPPFFHTIKSTYQRWKHLTYLNICQIFVMKT